MNAGLAGYLYRDETGPTSRNGIQLAYSYHVRSKNEKSKLGLGIELRALQFAINKSKLTDALGSDPLLNGSSSKIGIDAGAGVYWTNDKLSVGIAASQLIQSKLTFAEGASNIKESGRLYRHYNVTANYKIQTGDDIYLIPNAMARFIQNSPSEFDFGVNLDYKEKFWAGLNWRMNQFWSLQAGVKVLQKIKLTYSYDIYENPINVFSGGSEAHEIGLQFSLKK
ncbi:MAG: PorP/SprF family type IX secretion system membrane protein [Chitinophagaceae bacterium]|nr:PorP/SprF family type IX secretion system membrane protein [Chitinophagaceae bacterium]